VWWRPTLCRGYSATTDAAAAATALATGKKTDNGMAAVDPKSKAKVASILESARQAGLKTGNAALRSELSLFL
jgi:alkaline phosphatase